MCEGCGLGGVKFLISGDSGLLWKLGREFCHKGAPRKILGRSNILSGCPGWFHGGSQYNYLSKIDLWMLCTFCTYSTFHTKKKKNSNSKVKARAQVFGLPYCGSLSLLIEVRIVTIPGVSVGREYRRPCGDSGDALRPDQVLVTHVHTQVELHQSVHEDLQTLQCVSHTSMKRNKIQNTTYN